MVGAAAGAHGGLLECPQPRQGLARVEHAHRVPGGVDEPVRRGRHAREVAEEVERRALARQDRPQPTGHLTDLGAWPDVPAVVDEPAHGDRVVELREHLGRARGTGDHTVGARDDRCARDRIGGHERGGEVAERTEVFGERPRHGVAHDLARRVERGHTERPAPANSGTNDGSGPPAKTKRPRKSGDASG